MWMQKKKLQMKSMMIERAPFCRTISYKPSKRNLCQLKSRIKQIFNIFKNRKEKIQKKKYKGKFYWLHCWTVHSP